jgi:hypothetical protein
MAVVRAEVSMPSVFGRNGCHFCVYKDEDRQGNTRTAVVRKECDMRRFCICYCMHQSHQSNTGLFHKINKKEFY